MMNYTTDAGIRVIVSDNINPDGNPDTRTHNANVYLSFPIEAGNHVWTMADWFGTGPYTTAVSKNGRFAASFKGVNVQDVEDVMRHIDFWRNRWNYAEKI